MITAAIFSWVLAPAPVSQPPSDVAAPHIVTVDVERSDDTAQITARDSDGEVSAEMFIWLDTDGRTRLSAAWRNADSAHWWSSTTKASITLKTSGQIVIEGTEIDVKGKDAVALTGDKVDVN